MLMIVGMIVIVVESEREKGLVWWRRGSIVYSGQDMSKLAHKQLEGIGVRSR